ncbi:MAG: hypothetical protein KAU26_07370 [Methylococcales bacterium]|nr:hypothetical protein [Methylococcales bacterium]
MKKIPYFLIGLCFSVGAIAEPYSPTITANGNTIKLSDPLYYFKTIKKLTLHNYLVVSQSTVESSGEFMLYGLLNLTSKKYNQFEGLPTFSHSGSHIVTTNLDIEAAYNPNILRIYKIKSGKFILEYDAKPTEDWGPSSVKWLSPTKIEFRMVNMKCVSYVGKDYYDSNCPRYFLVYKNQKWKKELAK